MSDHPATISRSLAAALLLLSLCACAPASLPETAQDGFAPVRAEMPENAICRPDSALLAPQSPPDCKFGRPELKTVDPDQWARLNVDFERRCYQQAERTVRDRLRLLQASAKCEAAGFRR